MNPLTLLLVCIAGWMNRQHQLVIEHLQEEIHVLKNTLEEGVRESVVGY